MSMVITDFLEAAVRKWPDKTVYTDPARQISFAALRREALQIAHALIETGALRQPVAVYMEKGISCMSAMLGTAYSGNFYTVLDLQMPAARIDRILSVLQPRVLLTDAAHAAAAKELLPEGAVLLTLEDALAAAVDEEAVLTRTAQIIDTDILYVLFTSGSTGVPKGIVTAHRALIDYIEVAGEVYDLTEQDVIANQAPFYFVLSVIDLFAPLRYGCSSLLLPASDFFAPAKLMRYLEEKKATILNWVSSALILIARTKAFGAADLSAVRLVIFGGEVMPVKMLKLWQEALPEVMYVNCYGSTEVTDGCTYYVIDRTFEDHEIYPLGKPFAHMRLLVLDEENRAVTDDSIGELCAISSSIARGYYNDPEKTAAVFVQNPLQSHYPEIIFRTGDLVRTNSRGELVYAGRKDFQIKHHGHRVELGEIEANVSALDGVDGNCCLFHEETQRILLLYTGTAEVSFIQDRLRALLPPYMIPDKTVHLEAFPYNVNGKIDRSKLKAQQEELWK